MRSGTSEKCNANCHTAKAGKESQHPDHSTHVKKLNRVIGQLQGVQRMIEERAYCPNILIQTRAAAAALKAVELKILQTHLGNCVKGALRSTSESVSSKSLQEVVDLLRRY